MNLQTASKIPETTLSRRGFIFPDGETWLVFSPSDGLLFRTNYAAARAFRRRSEPVKSSPNFDFYPTRFTLSLANACGQACIYCYGTPAHQTRQVIDRKFCQKGIEWIAGNAAQTGRPMIMTFHGVGEPTLHWQRLVECIEYARETTRRQSVQLQMTLCTGGQLSQNQAEFVARHFDMVTISLDGPPDIQRFHRPRRDGGDPFEPAIRTARCIKSAGKRLSLQATVTAATVHRMAEITEFFAREIGTGIDVILGDVFKLPWTSPACQAPLPNTFVENFRRATDLAPTLGIRVRHPDITLQTLVGSDSPALHFCMTPFNTVVAMYNVPEEGAESPVAGAYGVYNSTTNHIEFDQKKVQSLVSFAENARCSGCLCQNACGGSSGVRGLLPEDEAGRKRHCRIRMDIAKMILKRAARRILENVSMPSA